MLLKGVTGQYVQVMITQLFVIGQCLLREYFRKVVDLLAQLIAVADLTDLRRFGGKALGVVE